MNRLFLTISMLFALTHCWTPTQNYNYQNYPVYFDDLYHGRPRNRGPGNHGPLDNQLTRSAMRSLLNPAQGPNVRTHSGQFDFKKQWNKEFGYNFLGIEAIQENIGCRARCRRLSEEPVCGENMTRYFNSCDAECDQVTYNTDDLRYNKTCCCKDNEMSLAAGMVHCIAKFDWVRGSGEPPKMILNTCLMNCLEKSGDKVAQDNDMVHPC